jgi:hypothetical protein
MADLNELVRNMQPRLSHQVLTFCVIPNDSPVPNGAIGYFTEPEGISIIIPVEEAQNAGLSIGFLAEWVTLEVQSDLSAVGLTSVVSTALAKAGISCNIVAGYHHDHLFVPAGKGKEALEVLQELQANHVELTL